MNRMIVIEELTKSWCQSCLCSCNIYLWVAMCCSMLHCVTVFCSALQCAAVCQTRAFIALVSIRSLQCVAVCTSSHPTHRWVVYDRQRALQNTQKGATHDWVLHTNKRVLRVRKRSLYRTPTKLQHKNESYIFAKKHHTSTNTPYIEHPKRFTKALLRASSISKAPFSKCSCRCLQIAQSSSTSGWKRCVGPVHVERDASEDMRYPYWCKMTAWN